MHPGVQEELRVAQLMVTPQHVADQSMADTTQRCQGLGQGLPRPAHGWGGGWCQPGGKVVANPVSHRALLYPLHGAEVGLFL